MATLSPAESQENFEQGVAFTLHFWDALSLAVQNGWGGSDSHDKRAWFAGAIVELFPDLSLSKTSATPDTDPSSSSSTSHSTSTPSAISSTSQPPPPSQRQFQTTNDYREERDVSYVEEALLQVMVDEFDVNVDDGSAYDVAEQIVRIRNEVLKGRTDEVEGLRRRWMAMSKGGQRALNYMQGQAPRQEVSSDSENCDEDEDEDEDVEMADAVALGYHTPPKEKEKAALEVDEGGFTVVRRKR